MMLRPVAKYETEATPTGRAPYAFELANGNPLGFAGLWDALKDKDGHWLQSCAIVTTEANELMRRIHPRMPVILHPRDYDRWLDRFRHQCQCARQNHSSHRSNT